MKRTIKMIFIGAIALALGFFGGCKKDSSSTVQTLKGFFNETGVPVQTFTINAGTFQKVVGAKRTIIYFNPNSLLDGNGNPVTGSVQVTLKEIYTKGDMILSNATTTSNGVLLQSGGEIFLSASKNGQQLNINPAQPLTLLFPQDSSQSDMQLFTGAFEENNNVAADSTLNWDPTGDTATVVIDTTGGFYATYFSFPLDNFGWSNCDRFWNLSGGTDPQVKLPTDFDQSNTVVYMVFDAERAAAQADMFSNGIFRFHAGEHTPIGLQVTIIAIAKKDDQYYYAVKH